MRWIMIGALGAVAFGGVALAQRERLPAECRQEIMQLCRSSMGGGMRACVRGALPKLSEACRKAVSERGAGAQPLPPGMAEMAYGRDPLQRLDLGYPVGNKRPPLILFIHGGGWSIGDKRHAIGAKASYFLGKGYAFASLTTGWSRRPRSRAKPPTSPAQSPCSAPMRWDRTTTASGSS